MSVLLFLRILFFNSLICILPIVDIRIQVKAIFKVLKYIIMQIVASGFCTKKINSYFITQLHNYYKNKENYMQTVQRKNNSCPVHYNIINYIISCPYNSVYGFYYQNGMTYFIAFFGFATYLYIYTFLHTYIILLCQLLCPRR